MSSPLIYFTEIAREKNISINSEEFARLMDERDELRNARDLFEYPKMKQLVYTDLTIVDPEEDSIYLCGNSLGLMPKRTRDTIGQVLGQWADLGVYGHHYGQHPWHICDEEILESMCRLVGGSTNEVAIMNQLTSCLHFLLISFYRPTESRFKILCEDKAFPSDHYAFEAQIRLHGLDPKNALITMRPRQSEQTLRTEDILSLIRAEGDQIAVICFSGVQYYTGQNFDMAQITKCGQEKGALVGWDLAHSVGNVELELHEWNVDFAVWCSYKYLNSGAGNVGAAFVHERLLISSVDRPVLNGWWGHEIETRMNMTNEMLPGTGIRKYRMSAPSALHCATLRASLEVFDKVGMKAVRAKSVLLTAYLEYVLNDMNNEEERLGRPLLQIITPTDISARGAQLSIICFGGFDVVAVHNFIKEHGLVCDVRKPNVIRLAACPLYNSFWDVYRGAKVLETILKKLNP